MKEYRILSSEEKEKEKLLKNKIKFLADHFVIPEIRYDASFVYKPHFDILTENLDRQVKEEAFKIFESIYLHVTS